MEIFENEAKRRLQDLEGEAGSREMEVSLIGGKYRVGFK